MWGRNYYLYVYGQWISWWAFLIMTKKKRVKKTNLKKVQQVLEKQNRGKNNTLIFVGLIIAISSIGLLIFVLSEKVFHLS